MSDETTPDRSASPQTAPQAAAQPGSAAGTSTSEKRSKPAKAPKKKKATSPAKKARAPKRDDSTATGAKKAAASTTAAASTKAAAPVKAAAPAKAAASTKAASKRATATRKATAQKQTVAGGSARPARGGALAAGAARASGERRRRSGTPLLPSEPVEVSAARRLAMLEGAPVAGAAPDTAPDGGGAAAALERLRPPKASLVVPAPTESSDSGPSADAGDSGDSTGSTGPAGPAETSQSSGPGAPVDGTAAARDDAGDAPATDMTSSDASRSDASRSDTDESGEAAPAPRRRPTRASMRARRTAAGEPTRLRAVPSVPDTDTGTGTDAGSGRATPAATRAARPARPARPTRPPRSAVAADPSGRHTGDGAGAGGSAGDAILGDILTDSDAGGPAERGAEHSLASGIQSRAERLVGAVLEAAEFSSEARPGPAELVDLAVNVLRAAATSAGLPAEEVERQVADALAYLRRRLTGDYVVDEFGFDEDYTVNVHLPLLRPLYRTWFRVEVRGIENIPSVGGALVVGNHSGTVAMDSLMTQVAVYDEHPDHRHLRMLGADLVFQMPFVGTMARRSGSTLAANTDAERLLRKGELVGVWPEGFKGVGKPFSERYKLQRFGRGGFVSAALRAGVPIVPVSIVGAEEIYPILGNMPTVARLLGLPYAPITPTFPLLGPLGMVPLPSKWLIEFGPPIDTTSFGPEAADDPMLVFDLTDQVRETIQQTLYSLLMQRKSVFL